MKLGILLVSFLFISCEAQTKAKVIGVKDGDSIEVLLEENKNIVIRLAEIDCPEKNQPYGKKAKAFVSDLIYNKEITFVKTDQDRYGRMVAKVYFKGEYLSETLIKNGLAWHNTKHSKSKYLASLEKDARKNKIGLWADPEPIAPWEWRKTKRVKK
jgi:endonuclease YncB( thermonuclease family)